MGGKLFKVSPCCVFLTFLVKAGARARAVADGPECYSLRFPYTCFALIFRSEPF